MRKFACRAAEVPLPMKPMSTRVRHGSECP